MHLRGRGVRRAKRDKRFAASSALQTLNASCIGFASGVKFRSSSSSRLDVCRTSLVKGRGDGLSLLKLQCILLEPPGKMGAEYSVPASDATLVLFNARKPPHAPASNYWLRKLDQGQFSSVSGLETINLSSRGIVPMIKVEGRR